MFWEGFFKQAFDMRLGTKGLNIARFASGKAEAVKPASMITTRGSVKELPLPTPKVHSAKQNLNHFLKTGPLKTLQHQPKAKGPGVAGMWL